MFYRLSAALVRLKNTIAFCVVLLLMVPGSQTRAQSLGDPIIDITFGSGTAVHGGPLAADSGSTTYTYSSGTPSDGFYTIVNTDAGMHTTWWTTTDHTGNPGGYFMLVNASFAPDVFYTRKVLALCGSTQYQFAAWVKNLINDNELKPNITFSIETTKGVVLGSGTTGDIPVANAWVQYPFTFITPANADTIVLKMTNNAPGGSGNDLAIDDITFRPYGAPVAVTFDQSQTAQTFCAGTSHQVTIQTTTALVSGYQQKLQMLINNVWVDQTPASTVATYTINTPVNAGVYEYRVVTAMSANVSSSNCVVASNDLTVTVAPLPVAAFSVPDTTCQGNAAVFTDRTTSTAAIKTWAWDFGDSQTSALQNPSHTYSQPGNYTVNLTVTNANGCSSTATPKTIHIAAVPVANFSVSLPDCVSRGVTLTDQSTVAEGTIKTWLWDYGDGITEAKTTAAPFAHTYTATGTYTITLVVTGTNGNCATRATNTITINPLPVVNFGLPDVCQSDSYANFTDSTTIADNTNSSFIYLWNFGDPNANAARPNTSTAKNPSHQYTSEGTYNVSLTVTSKYGCMVANTKTLTVNGAVPIAGFVPLDTASLCSNRPVLFKNTSTVDFGNITKIKLYFDYANDTTISITDNSPYPGKLYSHLYPQFQSPAFKNVTVYMIAYSGGKCQSPVMQTIRLRAFPVVNFAPVPVICQGMGAVQLTVTQAVGAFPAVGTFSGMGVSPKGLFDPVVSGTGTFPIQYIYSGNGCVDTVSQNITVDPSPIVKAGPAFTVLEGGSVVLQATSTGAVSYKWVPGLGLSSSNVLDPTVTPKATTLYTITATNADGCIATDTVTVTLIHRPIIPNTFTPNGDSINDTWEIKYLSSYLNCSVNIFNRAGQNVFTSTGYGKPWDGTYNGTNLPVGAYYYVIDTKSAVGVLSGSVLIIR